MPAHVARHSGAFLGILVAAAAAAAEPPPPDEFVRTEIRELAELLRGGAPDRVEVLRDRVRAIADFEGFARSSLGKTWETLRPAERRRFAEAIQRLLESYYLGRPGAIFDERKVTVEGARGSGGGAEVELTVRRKDVDVAVVVRLHRGRAGWLAEDVTIDGVSLLEDYRAQFRSFLKKRSVGELIDRLNSRAKAQYAQR